MKVYNFEDIGNAMKEALQQLYYWQHDSTSELTFITEMFNVLHYEDLYNAIARTKISETWPCVHAAYYMWKCIYDKETLFEAINDQLIK